MIVRFNYNSSESWIAPPHGLTSGRSYHVIGIEADDYRLLNDLGEPILYPASLFETTNAHQPSDWLCSQGDDGEKYAYPAGLARPGFFEDFFDAKPNAVSEFWQHVNQKLNLPHAS